MCGIVGFIAGKNYGSRKDRMAWLSQAIYVDTLRGNGGTGLAVTDKDGSISTYKRALAGPDFLNSMVGELGLRAAENGHVVIGHNRAATIGSVKDKNCHPFHYSNTQEIVLVHNGTLSQYYGLTPNAFTHEVDSAHAAFALAATDDEMSVLQKVKGPFVFVWFNKTKKTFNIARNGFRDIYYGYSEDGDMYFSSEWLMMDFLLYRNNIKLKAKTEYKNPNEDSWLEWSFNDDGTLKKPVHRKIKYVEEKKVHPVSRWNDPVTNPNRSRYSYHDKLKELGFEAEELLYVEMIRHEPYAGSTADSKYGRTICEGGPMAGGHQLDVSGLDRDQFEKYKKLYGTFLPVRLTGVKETKGEGGKVELTLMGRADTKELALWDNEGGPKTSNREDYVKGPEGKLIPFKEWEAKTKAGCSFCSNPIIDRNFDEIVWLPNAQPPGVLCHICSKDDEILELVAEVNERKGKKAS